jgi:hypothetical protein
MAALSLPAVSSLQGESSITLPADLLVTVELLSDCGNGRIHGSSAKSKDEMEGRLLLDVVVGKTAAIWF